MQNPFISVVVIAHDRKRYILDALNSLLNQDIDREDFEIVVVKNYSEPDIDARISKFNAINVITSAQSLGDKIQIALERCAGSVISFLEDDDKFEPDKLSVVKAYFQADERLCYYHNYYSPVDESDNLIRRRYRGKISGSSYLNEEINQETLSHFWSLDPDFNMSCISVRKSIVLPHKELLVGMHTGMDSLMLFIALSSGLTLRADSIRLTRFRIHNGSSTHRLESFEDFLNSTKGYFEKQKIAVRNISSLEMSNDILEHFSSFASDMEIGYYLINGLSQSRTGFSHFLNAAKGLTNHRSGFHLFYTILGFFGFFVPRFSRFAFFIVWKWYLGKVKS